jgi:DNA topoisomerase-1
VKNYGVKKRRVSKIKIKTNMTRKQSDKEKFDEAKALHNCIEKIRAKYKSDWKAKDDKTKQHSVALYLIDTLAIRPGTRESDKAFGCCSLLLKHITITHPKTILLKFPGKSSVLYEKEISVPIPVFTNLEEFTNRNRNRAVKKIFDKINSKSLNEYLEKIAGTNNVSVSCKVIRTYRANVEFEKKLKEYRKGGRRAEEQYKSALTDVAIFLNHQKDNGTKYNLDSARNNYIDPRITYAWANKNQVKMKHLYSKKLQRKFQWAFNESAINYKFAE